MARPRYVEMLALCAAASKTGCCRNDDGGLVDSRSRPCVHHRVLLPLVVLTLLVLPGVAAAQEESDAEESSGAEQTSSAEDGASTGDDTASDPPGAPALSLAVTPVVGDGPDDGDLTADPETGLPTLTFSPSTSAEQVATLQFTATNTGDVVLHDVAISDDRIGVVLDAASGTTLDPGASTTVRASATYTDEEAITGTAGLVVTDAQASASDDSGTTVQASATSTIQVVAVLPSPSVAVDLAVVPDAGDVTPGVGGVPTVTWSDEEVGEPRTVHYRLTATNTGPVALQGVRTVVDVLGTQLTATAADTTLAPGEELVVDLEHAVTVADLEGDTAAGVEVPAVAELEASDDLGQQVAATDRVVVLAVVVEPEAIQEELPATGPEPAPGVLAAALLALVGGTVMVRAAPRRVASPRVAADRRG